MPTARDREQMPPVALTHVIVHAHEISLLALPPAEAAAIIFTALRR